MMAERAKVGHTRWPVDDDVVVSLTDLRDFLVEVGLGKPTTENSGSPCRAAAQSSALPWGSASISNTRAPVRAKLAARFTLRVVLPTPPFLFRRPMIMFSSFTDYCIYDLRRYGKHVELTDADQHQRSALNSEEFSV